MQVYLQTDDRARVDWLTTQLSFTKSNVLRQALEALELRISDPVEHPALRIIGLIGDDARRPADYDVVREHDRVLADSEMSSWAKPSAAVKTSNAS